MGDSQERLDNSETVILDNPLCIDIWALKRLKEMGLEEMEEYGKMYDVVDYGHFMSFQYEWMGKNMYLKGVERNREPTQIDLVEEILNGEGRRARAFYCLKFRRMVIKNNLH